MQTGELYVNDLLIDLPFDSLVALSFAVNSLTDLKTVQGNISNSINLPATANNLAALGYPNDINFNGKNTVRKKLPCRYIQNGVEVIQQGTLRIIGATKDVIRVVISSGNSDFFDLISGKITDLNMSEYDHTWNQDIAINSRLHTSGYIYPIINYGNLANGDGTIYSSVINAHQMRPAVFAKTVVKKIIESAGYKFINKIVDDPVTQPLYDNLLLPFAKDKFVHAKRYIDQVLTDNLVAEKNTFHQYLDAGGGGSDFLLTFDHVTQARPGSFDGTAFTAFEDMTVDIDFHFHSIVSGTLNPAHRDGGDYQLHYAPVSGGDAIIARANLRIEDPNVVVTAMSPFLHRYEKTYLDYHLTATGVKLNAGDRIYMNIGVLYGCYQDINGVTLTINRSYEMTYGDHVQIESVLPDMTATDFLKFIQFLFCAIIQTDNVNKTVTIVPFGYIVQNLPSAVNWSDKLTNDSEDINLQIGDYCQQNEAKYNHDDTVSPDTYGNGSFYITDENLDLYQDIYDIPFAASLETLVLGDLRTLFINKITDRLAGEMSTATEARICLLNKSAATIRYQAFDTVTPVVISSDIPLTYFTGLGSAPDLTMKIIFKNHYTDLVNVLNDQRKLTCYLMLNEIDIQTLDFFKPVYIQKYAGYFYISKITDFTGLKPCKVELIKLS
jgi:hypothetical protein